VTTHLNLGLSSFITAPLPYSNHHNGDLEAPPNGPPSFSSNLVQELLAIGTALSGTQDLDELLALILLKCREITCSDAGSVYLLDNSDDVPKLIFKVIQNASLPQKPFNEFAVPLSPRSLAGYVALTGQSLNIPDAYDLCGDIPYTLDRSFDNEFSYRTRSVLVLPMQNRQGEVIGVVQLLNRRINAQVKLTVDNTLENTQPYSEAEENIVRSLASQAAISIERNFLQESIEHLFEGFVRASVQVIESRDPCTFGHSERVAELTVRLGEEVNSIGHGQLGRLYFDDRQIQEMRYAALLHDFGKVGVPERVLNKQKKLHPEQLATLQTRFALARRNIELERANHKLEQVLHHFQPPLGAVHHPDSCPLCGQADPLDQQLSERLEDLQNYWTLVLSMNEPHVLTQKLEEGEDTPIQKLTQLTRQYYRDDQGEEHPLLSAEELEQLLVPRGNLTQHERNTIESHVNYTYQFLQNIPWTRHLQNVPRIAYAHHEKLDGTGYPLAIKQESIPIQSQILTVADIYDALTASDRPYKSRVPLPKALGILEEEAHRGKVNGDLVALFKAREVYTILGHAP
jgi:HD-GYP domain-containing protein (c-di-GMP phosphodiesterase class II)